MERLQQHVVQILLALCRLFGCVHDEYIRDDVREAIEAGLDRWATSDMHNRVRNMGAWCNDVRAFLERDILADGGMEELLRTKVLVLRLCAAINSVVEIDRDLDKESSPNGRGASQKKRPMINVDDLARNQKTIFEFVRDNPGLHTKELTSRFSGELSDRTIQRSLKELAAVGVIRRMASGRSVAYEIAVEYRKR